MKKKKNIIVILSILFAFLIAGVIFVLHNNNKKEIYEDSAFKDLISFTSITGVKSTLIEDDVLYRIYTYTLEEAQENLIDKYVEYLTNEYGFEVNTYNYLSTFKHDNQTLSASIEKKDNIIEYKIKIPFSKEIAESNSDKEYNEALELIKKTKLYEEAYKKLSKLGDYKDSHKLMNYCDGMQYYEEYKYYGSAIKYLDLAGDILDAKEKKQEVLNIVSKYNGMYYAKHLQYPNSGIGHYMFVKDGKVDYGFESTYKPGDKITYLYELVLDGNEIMTAFVSGKGDIKLEYTFYENPDESILVIRDQSNEYDTFNGLYRKINNNV